MAGSPDIQILNRHFRRAGKISPQPILAAPHSCGIAPRLPSNKPSFTIPRARITNRGPQGERHQTLGRDQYRETSARALWAPEAYDPGAFQPCRTLCQGRMGHNRPWPRIGEL